MPTAGPNAKTVLSSGSTTSMTTGGSAPVRHQVSHSPQRSVVQDQGVDVVPGNYNHNNANSSAEATTEVTATTTFVNDGNEKSQVVRPVSLDASLAMPATDDNTIGLFMAKPVAIETGSWTSALSPNATLGVYKIGSYLVDPLVTPKLWANKLSGYNLMRGTAVLKFVLNSQPFQAGRLLLHFLPGESIFTGYSNTYAKLHNFSLATKTQQPNVELDISDGAATLRIPYVAPTLWFSRDSKFDWGTVYVSVLSPLSSQSSTTVNFIAYLYFEDFELAAPIYGPEMFVPEMDGMKNVVGDAWRNAKRERNRTKDSGVITTFFDFVKKPLDLLSNVPVIGTVASELSKASGSLGNVASYFGWSRPFDVKGIQVVQQHAGYRSFNFNGSSVSDVLAMDSMNQLAPMSNFAGSDVDEMSFSYLKEIPCYINRFSWSTSQLYDANLYSWQASPRSSCEVGSANFGDSGTQNVFSFAPFAHISRAFRYYRGGIVITLKVVKTQYHSGRMVVTFTPSLVNVPTNGDGRPYVYRDIIDIRESDTFSFTLPYMHPAPFLNTGFYQSSLGDDSFFGTFRVDVLNPLVAASTVSSSVDVLVYVSAAPDYQLTAVQPLSSVAFVPEMGDTSGKSGDLPRVAGAIGDAPSPVYGLMPSALCVGEVFTSLKQLFSMLRPVTVPGYGGVVGGYVKATWCPYYPALVKQVNTTFDYFTPTYAFDYVSEFGPGFAFSRGGIRMSIPEAGPSGRSSRVTLGVTLSSPPQPVFLDENIVPILTTAPGVLSAQPPFLPAIGTRNVSSSIVDTVVPAYGQTPFRYNYVLTGLASSADETIPTTFDSPDYVLETTIPASDVEFLTVGMSRSGADDFACGYFIGFGPVVLSDTVA